ncbi:hypothetical protein N7470_003592 [Penicillium chermesinum]|nr:hypothetical protein N7470_003592 [Penicillium chermesinum]
MNIGVTMSKRSVDNLKPSTVFVEDAEAQASHLGSYSQNVNASRSLLQEFGFEAELETFRKGALASQNQTDFEGLGELTEDDKRHLRRETTHKWHLPKALYFSIALCSLGSAIQGWDNTGANGANLSFPEEFGIADNTWLIGVINSGPTLFGLLRSACHLCGGHHISNAAKRLGCRSSEQLAGQTRNYLLNRSICLHRLSRKIGGACYFVVFSWVLVCFFFFKDFSRLYEAHVSLGMGVKISTIPVFSAEISPASIRGGLVTSFQLWVAFGTFIGFCSNLIFYRIGKLAWQFQLAAAFAPAVPVLIFVWFCPESPRWLMKKRRYQEAFGSFCRLRNTELIAARDLYYAHCQVLAERDAFSGTSLGHRVWELATVPRLRRAMISSSIIVISQQFSGINIMSFYSSTIFSEAGYSDRDCLLASLGFGLTTFVFALPAVWTMDTFGRRNLMLFTFPNMAWCLLAAGLCFLIPSESGARVPLIALFVYLFAAFYGPGIGPIPSIYFSEAFPLSHRELGAAFTICVNNAVGSALSLSFPSLLAKITPTGAFGFYAGLNILAFVTIFFVVPETMQRTLEELDYTFGVPTHRHAKYQFKTWLPWFVKRYVFFQRSAKLEPLYKLEGL